MTTPVTPRHLTEIASSIPGVTKLYAVRGLATIGADLGLPLADDPTARIIIDDDEIRLRVGIDHTRTTRDIARDIHRAFTHILTGTPHARTPITVEIATIR